MFIFFIIRYGSGKLTSAFLDRVFQECLTYEGEMDYKTFLDFVLALTHKNQPQSIQYLFKILDIQHKGYLNVFDLHFFFKVFWIIAQILSVDIINTDMLL